MYVVQESESDQDEDHDDQEDHSDSDSEFDDEDDFHNGSHEISQEDENVIQMKRILRNRRNHQHTVIIYVGILNQVTSISMEWMPLRLVSSTNQRTSLVINLVVGMGTNFTF